MNETGMLYHVKDEADCVKEVEAALKILRSCMSVFHKTITYFLIIVSFKRYNNDKNYYNEL